MDRNTISESIAKFILVEEIDSSMSVINCYNNWAQKTCIKIVDPDIASWALKHMERLLVIDKEVLFDFINN